MTDLSTLVFNVITSEISDLSSETTHEISTEISSVKSLTSFEISDLSSYTSTELSREISDLSSETLRDISDLSDVFMTAFMDGGVAFQKFTDLSSELHSGFADLSSNAYEYIDDVSYEVYTEIAIRSNETTIIDLSINRIDSELTDLSNYTSTELTRQIIDLSSYTSTELTRQVTDLSSYTSNELSREISDLSSETVSNIADLSSLMFHTLSTEISDLSSDTSREIDAVITDVSSYTSSELSREISDLSSETVRDIADLSSLTFHTLSIEISDLSSDTSHEISLVQVLTSYEISDLSSYTSSELSREVADLSSLTFQTLSIEISDLSSDTSHEISLVQVLTSYEISDLSSYTSAELSREVADHSSVVFNTISIEIADLSSETSVNIVDLSSYTSSELSREISDISSETVRDIADLSAAVFTRIRVDISNILAGAPETLDTLKEIADVLGDPNDPSFNLATIINNIVDISANLRNEITRAISVETSLDTNISDLSSYTSSELSREISDLSSETMSDISDLSSLVFGTISLETSDLSGYTSSELSREISDLSSYTSSELSRIVSDLSSYTSSELSREISDLSSETVRDISDLSSIAFHAISVDVLDLSSYASTELTRQITDLSGYTSTELTRQITDLSGYTSMELSREISDLSSQVVRDIIDLSGYTSMELSREIIDLSSETVKDISDLSSLVFETISIDVSENTAVFNIIDASFVTINNLLSTEILDLSSEVMRDISDLSSQVYQTIDDLPWEDTGSYLYTVNASQKVGIGISTPTSTLQLRATDSSGASLMIQSRPVSGTAPAQMFLTDRDESNGSMFNGLGVRYEQTKTFFDNYTLSTSSSQLMTFDHTNSNIGINTTTPTVDFEINGDLKITGSLIDGSGNSFSNLAGAFTDTTGGVELQLFTGATTTNKLYNDNGVLSFNGSSVAPTNLDFPYADGSRNQVLETDGSGNLQWVDNHDIYITPNPLHDTYNGIGYTDIISDLTHGIKFMTYAKLNNKRYVYTVSTDLRQIWRYDLDTTDYIQVAGGTDTIDGGSPVQGHADGYVGTSRFFLISDMKYSPYDNNIYIGNNSTDSGVSNSTLMRLNVYTNYVTTVVSNTEITGYGESHGPTYISFDTSGNVYYGSSSTSYGIKMLNIETMTQSGFIAPNELVPGTTLTWGIVWDNSENGYLIHNHGMSKLTSVGGGDLSYNNYSLYFGTYDYGVNDGGNVDATGSTAEVFYIRDVVKDHDVNSNALYFGTGQHGYLLKKVVPSASDPDLGTVTTLAGKLVEPNQNTTSFTSSDYPTISPTNTNIGQVESVSFDEWGNILFTSRFSSNNTLMFYAGIPYTRTGTQPVLPGDSINTMSDISLNNIQYGEFLMWNGESLVPTQAPNGGRSNTIPNLNFTKSNIKDVSQNMFFNTNSKYLLLDKRITIDKIRVNQKNTRALTIGYNVYINEYYDNSGTLQNVQSKTISNAVVSPVTSGETYGSTIVDISATSFTNRNYLEVLIERSTGYVYTEANNTVARFNFFPYVNQYLNNTDISDNLNGGYNLSVRSINKVIEDGNTGCVIIGDSSDNFVRIPAENGVSIDVKSMSFWIKNWTGGYIVDGRNVASHTQLTSNQYVEYGSANDINAGTGVLKFVNQDNLPYETAGIGGDPSNNSIGLLHKDEWNFVYIEFNSYATFTSANPLLFGTSIYGDGGSYTMKDLRLHSDTILTNDIENLFNNYDDNDVMVELIATPVERYAGDLADVSDANVLTGEFLKYDGTNYVPTNDVADMSGNLSDLSGHVHNMTITDLCDCIVTTNSYFIGASTSKGNYTTALGFEVMGQSTANGLEYNTAIGYRALYNTTSGSADRNTAIGSESLHSIATGHNNTAIGNRAGYSHTATNAVIIGYNTSANTSQSYGVAIGVGAVRYKRQNHGVFIGYNSAGGTSTGTGNRNIAIGSSNATGLTTGYDNVIIGSYSSNTMSTGYQNVIIGSNSSSNSSSTNNLPVDIVNAVGIGYASYPTESNTIRLGNTEHTNINTSASLTLGDVTYPTTDGIKNAFLITDGSGNISFTNYEVKPHLSNVTFDGSNAIIVEFSRDILYSADYNPSDFSIIHDGSSIPVLSVYELEGSLAINVGGVAVPGQAIVTPSYDLASQLSTLYSGSTSQYSHSSYYPDAQEGSNAFDAGTRPSNFGTNIFMWSSITSSYNSNGTYGSTTTTTVDGVSIAGEWLQVDIGQSVVVKTFKHLPSIGGDYGYVNRRQVKNAILATSTDNITWTEIGSVSFPTIPTIESTHTPTSYVAGRYFRYIVTDGHGDSNVSVKELTLLGVNESQYNAEFPPAVVDPSAVNVFIDLDKLSVVYTKSVDGSNNLVTTDGFTLGSFYYNGLGLTNIRNEELTDLSDISLNSTTLTSGHMIQYNGTQFTNIEPTIGDISFNGDLLPDVTNTRDIGSTSRKIKDIHVAGTVTTDQLSVGTATYPNTYGNTNQFLRANNTGTLYWSHVYLNDLYDVNTTSLANEHFLSYNSTSSSWLVSTLPNDNSANIVTLNSQVTDISNYTIALSAEISDLSNDTTEIISDLSSLVFSTLSTEIYDLSQETINDMADLSSVLHQRIYNDISAVIGGAGPALDTLKELEDYVTGLSGNTVGALITDLIDLSNGVPRQFNDLNDVSTAAITTGKLVKWDGNHFTETQLLYDEGSSGYIGIGTNSPAYPLTVDSYTTSNISNIGYLDQSGVALKQQQTDAQISIYASKGIWSGTSFFASSDMRIKQNIVDLIPDDCMELVKQLRPKRYGFVDHIKHGGREVYGFIAQEVQQICPDVVTKQTEFVPDIFKATEHISWSKVNKKWKLTIHDANITFKENTTVRFYVSDRKNSEIMKDVSNCKNDSKSFVFNKIYEDIFVYGHKVDNFLALDKEQLFTLHHGAILTLDNHQETITNDVTDLKRENGELKARVEELEHQLDLIKGHLGI